MAATASPWSAPEFGSTARRGGCRRRLQLEALRQRDWFALSASMIDWSAIVVGRRVQWGNVSFRIRNLGRDGEGASVSRPGGYDSAACAVRSCRRDVPDPCERTHQKRYTELSFPRPISSRPSRAMQVVITAVGPDNRGLGRSDRPQRDLAGGEHRRNPDVRPRRGAGLLDAHAGGPGRRAVRGALQRHGRSGPADQALDSHLDARHRGPAAAAGDLRHLPAGAGACACCERFATGR